MINFWKKCISWGGGHGRGATTTSTLTSTTSKFLRPLGVENSEFPILVSSCSGMQKRRPTNIKCCGKNENLQIWWGVKTRGVQQYSKKLVYLKSRWGEYKILHIKIINKKWSIFDIFCISWGGGHVRGATLTTITIITIITTTSKFLRPLRAETLLVSRLAQGCRKGDPQT